MERRFISPTPKVWHIIHQSLVSYWENELNKQGSKPPIPLILAGWAFSEDWENRARWEQTLKWVRENNCEHLIPDIAEEDKYYEVN